MREYNRSSRGGRDSGRRSFGGRGRSERPEMFTATCDQCGRECQVPFRPTGNKPVYCSDCFEGKQDDGGSRGRDRRPSFDRGGYGRDRGEKQMFHAVCDKCGKDCEVPFRPSSDKPIYCSKCFEGIEGSRDSGKGCNCGCGDLKADIEMLNKKLDKIIDILEPIKEVKTTKKNIEKGISEMVKEVTETAKKVAKKAKEEVTE